MLKNILSAIDAVVLIALVYLKRITFYMMDATATDGDYELEE